ncbi:MAG: aminotransferase class V-fold PLP-dependent enzyme [Candidatus Eisenbacteria bacterium]|uniref:Aminotransferase class V-fold PLP-dependent enzyme n=1 Tax=Eiseniibacteriota bacterium TaxID=2212470 RepID=A0A538TZM2_UNCEI|nr:MAG: aminotransferase class V-fold PLP-dependent enzyme [Candidatus Eisenbacteria bacterium]
MSPADRGAGASPAVTGPGAAAPASDDALLEWRREFPTVEATLHFISHSLGAMPRGVEESLRQYAQTWKARGIRAWDESWMAVPAEVAGLAERILGAEAGSVSLHANVTLAQASALSGVDFTPPRNRLVCTAEDFPSVLYLYEGLARRGVEVVRVPAREGRRIEEADVVAAIDGRTAVVALSQVLFRTSQLLDVVPIARRAREAGALTLIDAYQSVGTVPVDVRALGVDMLSGGSIKWMCGGPGTAYLYVNPALAARLEPALTGWFAHERPFDFDSGPMRWDPGPRRFWGGTPSIPSYLAARPGYEIIAGIGAAAIRAKSLRLTERMIGWADEFGWRLGSPREPARRGGTVCVDVPNAERVCQALLAADVLLDHRPGVGLRLAPHFYTRDDEVDLAMRRVREEVARAAG